MHIDVNNISWTPQESAPAPTPDAPVHAPKPAELAVEEHHCPLTVGFPCAEGRYIPQAVLTSFESQGIPYRLITSTKYSNGETAAMRNNIRQLCLLTDSPYIMVTDNDLTIPNGAWRAMVEFLEANPDFGAIAISKHGDPAPEAPGSVVESEHVDAGPVMWRREVLEVLDYTNRADPLSLEDDGKNCCECAGSVNALRQVLGLRIGFLAGFTCHHFHDTQLER